jgi:hypothetical protein
MALTNRSATWWSLGVLALVAAGVGLYATRATWLPSSGAVQLSADTAANFAVFQRLCEGKELAAQKRHQEALAVFDEISAAGGDSSYRWSAELEAAHAMGFLKQHEEALARLDRVIQDCPYADEQGMARLVQADVLSLKGDHAEGLHRLEGMVAEYGPVEPRMAEEALVTMMGIYLRNQQYGKIRGTLARLIHDYPGSEDTRRRAAQRDTDALIDTVCEQQAAQISGWSGRKVDKLESSDTTWTAAEGPYLVTDTLLVPAGSSLRVEPGTQVRFSAAGRLQVKGRLEVAGAPDQIVEFGPVGDDPNKAFWLGVEIAGGSEAGPSQLSHCVIRGADPGLKVESAQVGLTACTFDRCGAFSVQVSGRARLMLEQGTIVDGHRVGLDAQPGTQVELQGCTLSGLVTAGIILKEVADQTVVRGCRIEKCGAEGLLVRGRCTPVLEKCQISRNAGEGIRSIDGASPNIIDCEVQDNRGAGVRLQDHWAGELRGSLIRDNAEGGISAQAGCKGVIEGNRIENNRTAGLLLRLGCEPTITGNRIASNQGPGLLLQESTPGQLKDNQFLGNLEAALRNEGSNTIDAKGNWWGTTDEASISKLVQDRRLKPEWGEVQVQPWLNAAPDHPAATQTG